MVHHKHHPYVLSFVALCFCNQVWAQDVPEATPQTYTVQSPQTQLDVLVKYDRTAIVRGHDHVIQTRQSSGTIVWAPNNPSLCKVDLSFPVESLQVDPPGSRERHSLNGTTSENDKKTIKRNMLGKTQLQAEQFHEIRYTAKTCVAKGSTIQVTGDLTLRGQTKTVTSLLKIAVTDGTFTAKGQFRATHDDFGMKPYTALMGALRNDTLLNFYLDVTATP